MLARKLKINSKILLALVLCVSFLTAAVFDERVKAEQKAQESSSQTHITVPFAE